MAATSSIMVVSLTGSLDDERPRHASNGGVPHTADDPGRTISGDKVREARAAPSSSSAPSEQQQQRAAASSSSPAAARTSTTPSTPSDTATPPSMATSFYELSAINNKGVEVPFSIYRGKIVLIVNTASQCGFTSQYEGLQALYDKYRDRGLEILAFPCNQFGGQEPGSNEEIAEFCTRFRATFPIFAKVDVNGDNTHPVYAFLKERKTQLFMSRIKWNFEKFLVDREGNVVDRFASTTTPAGLEAEIEKLL